MLDGYRVVFKWQLICMYFLFCLTWKPQHYLSRLEGMLGHSRLQDNVAKYRGLRSTCTWELCPNIPIRQNSCTGNCCQKCEVSTGKGEDHWEIVRFGPSTTYGDLETVSILYPNAFRITPGIRSYVTASMGSVQDVNDNTILSPSVHIHHNMLFMGTGGAGGADGKAAPLDQEVFDRHDSDMSCTSDEGGPDCLYFEMPAGFGQLMRRSLSLISAYNDIRAGNSSALVSYIEMSLRRSRSSLQALYRISAIHSQQGNIRLEQVHSLWPAGAGISIPKYLVAFWYAAPFELGGRVVYAHVHAHRHAEKKVLIWDKGPHLVGLNQGPWVMQEPFRPLPVTETMVNALRDTHPPLCESEKSAAIEELNGQLFDHDDKLHCASWSFQVNDMRTVMCVAQTPDSFPNPILGFHCELHLLVTSNSNRSVPHLYLQTSYPDGQWWPGFGIPAVAAFAANDVWTAGGDVKQWYHDERKKYQADEAQDCF